MEGTLLQTSDQGWGCAHRSAQMLLCCALVRLKLGVSFRLNARTVPPELYECVRLFGDTPAAPFSIHALSNAAFRLSKKKVGDWLGPSTASLALRGTILARQPFELRAYIANNGVVYKDELPARGPVLVLVPLRLGLERINPDYIPLLKMALRCPLCVGIIGGRESSSFYFLGYQDDQAFFMDPHTVQPTVDMSGDGPFPLESYRQTPQVR